MFVGCSEIGISIIVKHVQHVGIIRAFCLPGGLVKFFQCLGRQKKTAGLLFVRGD